jgi:hypothetical protein
MKWGDVGIESADVEQGYQEQLRDPAVRERLRQIFDEAKRGSQDPGVTAEELPNFLREHNR